MTSLFNSHSIFYKGLSQAPSEVVDITNWSYFGDFTPYAIGTRDKFDIFCPKENKLPFLMPEHRYLYKKTIQRKNKSTGELGYIYYEQFWCEIIAYILGRHLGIEVPPSFVACRNLGDSIEYACLSEWFYGYPNSLVSNVKTGGDLMTLHIPSYDRKKGEQHNFETICKACEDKKVINWQEHLIKTLLLDAIIGNTDRHQENWEIITNTEGTYLSPAFDNGTSLGYDILNEKIDNKLNALEAHINKGTHHLKWKLNDKNKCKHFELLKLLAVKYPFSLDIMRNIINIDCNAAFNQIRELCNFDIQNEKFRLTRQRADFICEQIRARLRAANEILTQ
jgi:hypothetical protein